MRHPVDCSLFSIFSFVQGAKKLNISNMQKLKLMKSLFSGCTFFFLLILICLHTYNHKNSASYSPNYYNHDHHSGKDYYIEWTEHTILPEIKVQLNSECIHEVIVSPKMQTLNYKDFCPTKKTWIVAKKTAYTHQKIAKKNGYYPCLFGRAEILVI